MIRLPENRKTIRTGGKDIVIEKAVNELSFFCADFREDASAASICRRKKGLLSGAAV